MTLVAFGGTGRSVAQRVVGIIASCGLILSSGWFAGESQADTASYAGADATSTLRIDDQAPLAHRAVGRWVDKGEAAERFGSSSAAAPFAGSRRPTPIHYTVRVGETLNEIANRFNTTVGHIVSLNRDLDPNVIVAGDALTIQPDALVYVPLPENLLNRASAANPAPRLWAPYRTQFDGDPYEGGNCGPATLAMAMAFFGEWHPTNKIRESVNRVTGDWSYDGGSDWPSMHRSLETRGFATHGPFNPQGAFRYWDVEDLMDHVKVGRPVILLVKYKSLPGHEHADWIGDHYIVFLGLTNDGMVVYHDPGFRADEGAYRKMDRATLEKAWSNTWVRQNRTAMAVFKPR